MNNLVSKALALIVSAAALSSVAGCSPCDQRLKAEYTVDQYLAKRELMEAKLRECGNNPGELRDTPDCINVTAARYQGGMGGPMNPGSMNPGPVNPGPVNPSLGSASSMGAPQAPAQPAEPK